MKNLPLNILDLVPKPSKFTLSKLPGVDIELEPWSLYMREWAVERWGSEEAVNEIFTKLKIGPISQLAFEMLKDKTLFATYQDLQKVIGGPKEQLALIDALLETVGVGEPEKKAIQDALDKSDEKANGKKVTGTKSPNAVTPNP